MSRKYRSHSMFIRRGSIWVNPGLSVACIGFSLLALCLCVRPVFGFDDFAMRVVDYSPAPGQRVRDMQFNLPERALGAPGTLGGLSAPDNSKVVTLGGFGGSITLGFDHSVWRNRFNPRGYDFIVYGNALYAGGDPLRRFAECGVVEVSRDDNHNGLADDAWYLIPGSHLAFPYPRTTINWNGATMNPNWIPPAHSPTDTWSTTGYLLSGPPFDSGQLLVNTNTDGPPATEQVWGYADIMPTVLLGDTDGDGIVDKPELTAAACYTAPDDPLVVGVSAGSGGGAAFRIAWAVDPATGQPANLDRIDFVRITTAVSFVSPLLGEVSTEISGVADVRPVYTADWNQDGSVTVDDIFVFLNSWFAGSGENGGADFDNSGATTVDDIFVFLNAWFRG
jgi:hypothetical protein